MDLATQSTRQEFEDLFSLYLAIGITVAVLVWAAIAYALIRRRRREGVGPREIAWAKPLEGVWIALVAAVVVVLLVSTFRTEGRVDPVRGDPRQTVRVVAFQWGWRFSYPGTGITTTGDSHRLPVLVVPSGIPVRFELTSRDVIHAFWIPQQKFKRDAFPNRVTDFDLVFDPGVTTTGRCAEFCGLEHDRMNFQVAAMSPDRFARWLRSREAGHDASAGRTR
jgi:cytochrome c oxidase subunit 2